MRRGFYFERCTDCGFVRWQCRAFWLGLPVATAIGLLALLLVSCAPAARAEGCSDTETCAPPEVWESFFDGERGCRDGEVEAYSESRQSINEMEEIERCQGRTRTGRLALGTICPRSGFCTYVLSCCELKVTR